MKKVFFKIKIIAISLFILMANFAVYGQINTQKVILAQNNVRYLSNEIIIKLRFLPITNSAGKVTLPEKLNSSLSMIKVTASDLVFPDLYSKANETSLANVVSIKYEGDLDPQLIVAKLKNSGTIEWVEPHFVYLSEYTPNDPRYAEQWALSKIKAGQAWDISQGSTDIIIGIVDTGVQWDHPDLNANMWVNSSEIPGNGIDDDNNGFIDDYLGWDFGGFSGTADPNPTEDNPDHGTHVAGIASAATNNSIGVAGIGFNCKIMAVKTSQNNNRDPASGAPYIVFGDQGIVYAANNGAKIINCSWGGGGYSILGQMVIDYAATKGAIVVAAAGNENYGGVHYPSDFDKVVSVASTNSDDTRSSFSNYGKNIAVSAPGSSILGTWMTNAYASLSGTSMASPLMAGLIGLVKAKFPNYNYFQCAQQIRATCDNIEAVNPNYTQLLGKGRINAYNAVSVTNAKSVRAIKTVFSDQTTGNGNGVFEQGELINVYVKFRNYLAPTSQLSVQLVSKSTYATVTNNATFNAGALATLDSIDNQSAKYVFKIADNCPADQDLPFILQFSDGTYSDFQWTTTSGNPTYATQSINNVAATISSTGNIGFADYPTNSKGLGFTFEGGSNMLFEGSLIVGYSPYVLSNSARGSNPNLADKDFVSQVPFTIKTPGSLAAGEGFGIFNDKGVSVQNVGINVQQKSYSFLSSGDENYIIIQYKLKNTSPATLTNVYAGLFLDWDMVDGQGDKAEYYNDGNFGQCFYTTGGFYTRVAAGLVSQGGYNFWAIKNDGSDGSFGVYDNFTKAEKFQALSSGIGKASAGPGDVSMVVAGGPYTIPVNEIQDVAFALVAAPTSTSELSSSFFNARAKYQMILTGIEEKTEKKVTMFKLEQNYPNPISKSDLQSQKAKIGFSIPQPGFTSLKLYNILGKEVAVVVDRDMQTGSFEAELDIQKLPSGIYVYELRSGGLVERRKLVVLK